MQNFTLGKKGMSMLFFTLFLLIGSFTSYGQCPNLTVGDEDAGTAGNQQVRCYLERVSSLTASSSDSSRTVRWYRNNTSNTPIPENEILQSGTYFAGYENNSCNNNREPVSVTVNNPGAPTSTFGNFYEPCEYSTDDNTTAGMLADAFNTNPPNDSNYTIEVYEEEFSGTKLADTTELTENRSYFVGQRFNNGTPNDTSDDGCPSTRVAIFYNPILTEAPTGEPVQTFCNTSNFTATVADLEASGINRWYSTSDSNPPLDPSTPLIDGETYYASQIVNRNNSSLPPCESIDRFEVTAEVNNEEFVESEQQFCQNPGDDSPKVKDLNPSGATWYAESDSATALNPETALVDGEDYFNRDNGTECSQDRVTVIIDNAPQAGDDVVIDAICFDDFVGINNNPVTALAFLDQFQAPSFDPTTQNISFDNDPTTLLATMLANPAGGNYSITYTIENNDGSCSDSATTSIIILDSPDAGDDNSINVNRTDSPFNLIDRLNGTPDAGGTWSPGNADGSFDPATANSGDYTYTVNNGICQDQAVVSVTIFDNLCPVVDEPNQAFCPENNPEVSDLTPSGATWYEDATTTIGLDPSTPLEDGKVYYAGNANGTCTDRETVTVEIYDTPNAGQNGDIVIQSTDAPFNLFTELEGNPTAGGVWSPGNADGSFDPSTGEEGVYTYKVTSSNSCQASSTVTVTIKLDEGCPPVADAVQEFCRLIPDATFPLGKRRPRVKDLEPKNATWYVSVNSKTPLEPENVLINNNIYYAGNTQGTCAQRETVKVILDKEASAGADTTIIVCSADAPFDVVTLIEEDILTGPAQAGGTFSPAFSSNSTIFDPAVDVAGEYTYTVNSPNSVCSADTSVITIEFKQNETANAGADIDVNACSSEDDIILADLLASDVTKGGTFEGYDNGIFSPTSVDPGTYTITYKVGEDVQCVSGSDESTITIIVGTKPATPVAEANQDLCLIDTPTVADIVITGENIVWYEDEALTTTASGALENDEDYYAVSVSDSGCISDSVKVTVTLNDSVAPTLSFEGNEFCRQDNPTVQELINNLNGDGIQIYQSATGGSALTSSTLLQNGSTYYATSTDASVGCESTERLSIVVSVEFCGIPEGFSPNEDGINDRFVIPDLREDYPNFRLEVYNRWEKLVYKGGANLPDWDGTSNQSSLGDDVLPVGYYFYILYYNDGQTEPVQGKVYLSR